MRRVLIVHYHFLPVHNVAVKKLCGYVRHLRTFGWEPIVLTRDWRSLDDADPSWGLSWEPEIEAQLDVAIHRVPHTMPRRMRRPRADDWPPVRKALSLAQMMAGRFPDDFIGWARAAEDRAARIRAVTPFDVVLPYCPPETNVVAGSRIARRLRVPSVPFFGDLYGFFLAPLPPRSPGAAFRRRVHRRWMRPAAACMAVSPYMVDYLHRTFGVPSSLVLAGFEPADWRNGHDGAPQRGERFVASHVGSIYPWDQRPGILLDGLDRLLARRPDLASRMAVRLVGSKCDAYLRDAIRGRPCEAIVQVLPKVRSTEAVSLVRRSHALFVFNCTAHRDRHGTMSHPTKIFEAFGAGRPVLAMPPDGDWVDRLLTRTGGGTSAATPADVARVLLEWFESWNRTGRVEYAPHTDRIAELTTERQTERLAAVLSTAVGANRL